MKFEDWSSQWEELARASQKEMQFFVGREQPVTIYRGTTAFVDPTCPCKPGHEEWACIDSTVPGKDTAGRDCLFLQVSQPATFRVLFWYDPNGISTDECNEDALRYWYQVSTPFGNGCSWVRFPEEDGEYLCCFSKRSIRILQKIATIEMAQERTLLSRQACTNYLTPLPDSRAKVPDDPRLYLALLYPGRLIRDVQVDIIEVRERNQTCFYLVRKANLASDIDRLNDRNIYYYPDIQMGKAEVYTIIATSDECTCIEADARIAWKELDQMEMSPRQEQLWDMGL